MHCNVTQFSVVGLSHQDTPVEVREKVAFSSRDTADALQALKSRNLDAAVILSTCNRSEVYALATPEQLSDIFAWRSDGQISADSPYLYSLSGESAVRHLFEVACGLHSQVLGENQILGQIRKAFFQSQSVELSSGVLHEVFERALKAGKQARTTTNINYGSVSLATLTYQLLKNRLLPSDSIAVVGTGEMGTKVAKELAPHFTTPITLFSHTQRFAQALASEVGGVPASMTDFQRRLNEFHAIVCATEAPHPVLDLAAFSATSHKVIAIDLGMPRNIDEDVREHPSVELANLDDLKAGVDDSYRIRRSSIGTVRQIIEDELRLLTHWVSERRAAPIIRALDSRKAMILNEELSIYAKRFAGIPDAEKLLEQFGRRLLNRALNPQIDRVKEFSRDDRLGWELLSELFSFDAANDDVTLQ